MVREVHRYDETAQQIPHCLLSDGLDPVGTADVDTLRVSVS